jgi:hypothetical protein
VFINRCDLDFYWSLRSLFYEIYENPTNVLDFENEKYYKTTQILDKDGIKPYKCLEK